MLATSAHVRAIFLVFFCESAVLGSWIPRIPDIKNQLQLSSFELGLCLFALSAGTMLTFFVAGSVVQRFGLRKTCQFSIPAWALLFIFPGMATNGYVLFIALLFCGVAVALSEVAMNTMADEIEKSWARRIMSRCHGFWSLGSMFGAAVGAMFARQGISTDVHFLTAMPVIGLVGWLAATALPTRQSLTEGNSSKLLSEDVSDGTTLSTEKASVFRLPHAGLLMLCVMPIGVMCVEGAFIDWSAVFMDSILNAGPVVIGVTYAFFSLVMAITRLTGDSIIDRVGEVQIARVSALAAALGIGVFAAAVNPMMAFAGAALAGLGTAIIYPLAISAAAARPGVPSDNVAALSLLAFTAFLVAPPLTGFIADVVGLRLALLLLVPAALTTFWLSKEVAIQENSDLSSDSRGEGLA